MEKKCNGENCTAINGRGHSQECINEYGNGHDRTNTTKQLDTPGNREPNSRYRGYKNEPLDANYTADQLAAWEEGKKARLTHNG